MPKKKELLSRIERLEAIVGTQKREIDVLMKRTEDLHQKFKEELIRFDGPRTDPTQHKCKTCNVESERKTLCMYDDCPHMQIITFESDSNS